MNSVPPAPLQQDGDALIIFSRVQRLALACAGIGAILSVISLVLDLDRTLHSYLYAFCFWNGIALGSLGILMLHFLTGGRWGALFRRPLEAAALTLPYLFVCMIPIVLTLPRIYLWSRPEAINIQLIRDKAAYLNSTFFAIRVLIYFGIWSLFATLLRRWSLEEDRAVPNAHDKLYSLSAPGVLVFVITVSFAAMDWAMSLEPEWYSTIYGLVFMVEHGLTAIAASVLVMRTISQFKPASSVVTPLDFGDFGNLLLVFVMLSAYMNFSQFLIIWSGNIPAESVWYLRRSKGGWEWILALVAIIQFFAPFLILLFRRAKRNADAIAKVALLIAVACALELYWLIMPAFEERALPHLSDPAALLLLGGLWIALFLKILKRAPFIAMNAPELNPEPEAKERVA